MRKVICLIFLLSYLNAFTQLDLEHWFPPVYRSINYSGSQNLGINITSPHSTPFKVYVYTKGGLQATFTVSKDHPAKYNIAGADYIAGGINYMKVKDTGIHLVGENSFFAEMRFYQGDNSEMIYSQGKSALGLSFLSINPPIDMYEGFSGLSSMTSIMATRDNTTVTFSGFDKKIKFIDGSVGEPKIIKLNKGESYVFVSLKSDNFNIFDNEYFNTLSGAKIESDKPITVISGCFNGQYGYENGLGSTLLEQIMPIKKLGKEFFMKSAFSNISKQTEKALIVATKDNTKLFINGNSSPAITLNSRQYYLTPISLFSGKDMYINASEPIYCFQLSSGTNKAGREGDYSYFAESMSYLQPFDSNIPGSINKIISAEKIGDNSYKNFLNILIPNNNTLKINNKGVDTQYGPYSIIGNDSYKYYSIKDFSGDAKLESENGLIAELIGGSTELVHGWSSSVTGFSNDPYIIVNGNCIQEQIFLTVSNIDFESFQWKKDGVAIPGATSSTYIPTLPGNYNCELFYSGLSYNTLGVLVDDCPYAVNEINLGNICNEVSGSVKFSSPNSSLNVDRFKILTNPANGKLTIDSTNKTYHYIADDNFSGSDRFLLELCNNQTGLCEAIMFKIKVLKTPKEALPDAINATYTDANFSTYDLTKITILDSSNKIQFYISENLSEPIQTPQNYKTNNTEVYAKITNDSTVCYGVKKINLIPMPIIPDSDLFLPNFLSPNNDGINDVLDFSILKPMLDVKVVIYDRYSKKMFQNDQKTFHWDGKDLNHIKVPSSTYWAEFSWVSPKTGIKTTRNMWISLKNN